MSSSTIPLLMVIAFLLLTLIVGLYFSRNTVAFREYAIGNKKFPTATLVATVLATGWGGAGLFGIINEVHKVGLYWIVFCFFGSLSYWPLSQLALRVFPFIQNLSMAETVGSVYGLYPRIITALSSICVSIIVVAMQVTVMSMAISTCVVEGFNSRLITAFATLILIFYSIFGGIRAVTYTDVLQFVTFAIIIPLLSWFMFIKTKKPIEEIIPFLQNHEKFQFRSVFHFDTKLLGLTALILSNLASAITPSMIQRMYMASGPIQANRVFRYSIFFDFIITFFIILVGLFVFVGAPALPETAIWNYIVANVPSVFKGFICIGLLSMTMSTADSLLNSCAVMIAHDMVESVRGVPVSPYTKLWLARLSSLIIGLSAMVLAFYNSGILELLYLAFDFSIPIVTAPFILAVFGFRGTSRTALIGMATGVLTILAWNKWVTPKTGIDGSFICMLANGFAMMAAHYLLSQPADKGWVEPDDHYKQVKQAAARRKERRKEQTIFTLGVVGVFCIIASFFCFIFSGYAIGFPLFQLSLGIGLIGYAYLLQTSIPD